MRTFVVVAIAAMAASMPAVAEGPSVRASQDVGGYGGDSSYGIYLAQEVDLSFEASRARLVAVGYTDVRRMKDAALYLWAFDSEGSEVLLVVNPQNGEIDETHYVHMMDE